MMNSKEALERIEAFSEDEFYHDITKEVNIIKQDLERLEKLEKVIEKIKNLSNCDNGCMYLQNKLKKILLIDIFENMFINCKVTPLPELEEE